MAESKLGAFGLRSLSGCERGRWVPRMLSKGRNPLSGSVGWPSLAGRGLLERMRSTTFALLGGTALFGLVIVAIMSQQGLPYLPSLPLPGISSGGEEVSGAAVAERLQGGRTGAVAPAGVGPTAGRGGGGAGRGADEGDAGGAGLATSRQIETSSAPPPQSGTGQPGGEGAAPAPPSTPSSPELAVEASPASNSGSTADGPASSAAAATAAVGSNGSKGSGRKAPKDPVASQAAKQAKPAAPKSSTKSPSGNAAPAEAAADAASEAVPPPGAPNGPNGKDSGKDRR
jgi:hypothetical protein